MKIKSDLDSTSVELDQITKGIRDIKKSIVDLKQQKLKLKKDIKSARGKLSLRKGIKRENEIRKSIAEMIEKEQGVFTGYRKQGFIHSINIRNSQGSGCEMDVFVHLQNKKKKQDKFALIAEVKNTKQKISMKQAKKYLATIKACIYEFELREIRAFYISGSGFAKGVQEYLEKNGVVCSNCEKIFCCK